MAPRRARSNFGDRDRWIARLGLALVLALGVVGDARAKEPGPQEIWGGQLAERCALPTVVWLPAVGCSGVAVAPDLILTAAHCTQSLDQQTAVFGEDAGAPARTIETLSCVANPDWTGLVDATDFGYCLLTEAVELDLVPIARGCELAALGPGQAAVLAGFGEDEQGLSGRKRHVETEITAIQLSEGEGLLELGGAGLDSCLGDSGGPVLVELEGGWRIAGLIIGGDQCGQGGLAVGAEAALRFAEVDAGRDLDPCRDSDGVWAPTAACGGFALAPLEGAGTWAEGCAGPLEGPSMACGPAHMPEAAPGCACGVSEPRGGSLRFAALVLLGAALGAALGRGRAASPEADDETPRGA